MTGGSLTYRVAERWSSMERSFGSFEAGKPWAGYVAQHAAHDLGVHCGLGRKMGVESADREPGSLHDARDARGAKSFAPGDPVR